jgi:hypothetical protein|nr:MAG TPA: hypothetical protein [Caudoviricetes sp.]
MSAQLEPRKSGLWGTLKDGGKMLKLLIRYIKKKALIIQGFSFI